MGQGRRTLRIRLDRIAPEESSKTNHEDSSQAGEFCSRRRRGQRMNVHAKSGRILILTAGFGEGHNAAASAMATGFSGVAASTHADGRVPSSAGFIVDAFALAAPRFNDAARRLYLNLINRAPRLWSSVYGWIDRSELVQRRMWLFRREIRVLGEVIKLERPAAI